MLDKVIKAKRQAEAKIEVVIADAILMQLRACVSAASVPISMTYSAFY